MLITVLIFSSCCVVCQRSVPWIIKSKNKWPFNLCSAICRSTSLFWKSILCWKSSWKSIPWTKLWHASKLNLSNDYVWSTVCWWNNEQKSIWKLILPKVCLINYATWSIHAFFSSKMQHVVHPVKHQVFDEAFIWDVKFSVANFSFVEGFLHVGNTG